MIMDLWSFIAAVSLGLGLSAACGFRAFLPPLLIGIFSRAELITLGESWQWFSSDWAIALFAIAALFELCAYTSHRRYFLLIQSNIFFIIRFIF